MSCPRCKKDTHQYRAGWLKFQAIVVIHYACCAHCQKAYRVSGEAWSKLPEPRENHLE